MSKVRKLNVPGSEKTLADQYPNDGVVENIQTSEIHPNNYFIKYEAEENRKRYLKFSIFMEELNNTLDLQRGATVEQFAGRIADLVTAVQKQNPD